MLPNSKSPPAPLNKIYFLKKSGGDQYSNSNFLESHGWDKGEGGGRGGGRKKGQEKKRKEKRKKQQQN